MKVTILEPEIKGRCSDLFYDKPYEALTKDGITFYVEFMGEVEFDFKGTTYYANTLQKLFDDPDFNDEAIEKIEFVSNGWLEIQSKEDTLNLSQRQELAEFLDERDIEGSYDGGLQMLKRISKEWEDDHE